MTDAETEVLVQEKRARAVALKTQGLSYSQIAEQIQCSKSRAFQLYREALLEIPAEEVEEHRKLEAERLEYLWRQVCVGLSAGADPQWVQAGIRVRERWSRLFGLDLPSKVQATIDVKTHDPLSERILDDPVIAERYLELVELAAAGLPRAGGPGRSRNGAQVPPAASPEGPHT